MHRFPFTALPLKMIYDIFAMMLQAAAPTAYPRRIAPHLPMEIISLIVEDALKGASPDSSPLPTLSLISKPWMYECRRRLFKNLSIVCFHDIDDILLFMRITSTPLCTFPNPIKCRRVEFKDMIRRERYYDVDYVSTAVQRATSALDVVGGAFIQGTNRGIPYSVRDAFKGWWIIKDLTLSGGTYTPPVLFKFLGKLPHLQHLCLSQVEIDDPAGQYPSVYYAFPVTLIKLSVCSSADIWAFFKWSVLPGGGMDTVEEVQIQDRFPEDYEPRNSNHKMLDCLSGMPNLQVLGLEPVWPTGRASFLSTDTPRLDIPRSHSLKKLQFNLTQVPFALASKCLNASMQAHNHARFPIRDLEVNIGGAWDVPERVTRAMKIGYERAIGNGAGGRPRTRVVVRYRRQEAV